ncbi:hypothetical protein MAR_019593, partial [Mya arenaria]
MSPCISWSSYIAPKKIVLKAISTSIWNDKILSKFKTLDCIYTESSKSYNADIFGKQIGEVKHTGLVDSLDAENFSNKLEMLKPQVQQASK